MSCLSAVWRILLWYMADEYIKIVHTRNGRGKKMWLTYLSVSFSLSLFRLFRTHRRGWRRRTTPYFCWKKWKLSPSAHTIVYTHRQITALWNLIRRSSHRKKKTNNWEDFFSCVIAARVCMSVYVRMHMRVRKSEKERGGTAKRTSENTPHVKGKLLISIARLYISCTYTFYR